MRHALLFCSYELLFKLRKEKLKRLIEIQVAQHLVKYLHSLCSKEIQLWTLLENHIGLTKYHFMNIELAKIKLENSKWWQGAGEM